MQDNAPVQKNWLFYYLMIPHFWKPPPRMSNPQRNLRPSDPVPRIDPQLRRHLRVSQYDVLLTQDGHFDKKLWRSVCGVKHLSPRGMALRCDKVAYSCWPFTCLATTWI